MLSRLDEVLARGTFASERAWCRAASVSESYIGALRTKHKKGEATTAKIDVVQRLAEAAGVSVDWLMGGEDMPLRAPDPARSAPTSFTQEVVMSAQAQQALERFEWPTGTPTAVVAEISDALAREAFKHRGSFIPASHWNARIQEELAARKGKRIAHVMTDDPVEDRKRRRT